MTTTPSRPTIVVREELVALTDDALAALQQWAALDIYQRSRGLVQVARTETAPKVRWLKRPAGGPVILALDVEAVLDRLDRAAWWVRPGRKGTVPARPPEWCARQILRGRLSWTFPPLTAVIETPTIRSDGTVLEAPGYDDATGVLYLPNAEYPVVPEELPTAEAVAALLDPVCDVPFINQSSSAAYVAAVLTLLARHAIDGFVPGFPIRAPVASAGKGLLAKVIALIGTGREPAITTQARDEDEWRKRLLSIALAGTPLIQLDNLSGTVGSDQLAAAFTAPEWSDRLLGASRMVSAPLYTVWVLTGNNITFAKTLARRMVPIDIDPQMEHPEDRTNFKYPDLPARVRAMRTHLVVAALALLRNYVRAGQPSHGKPPMGSFEAWDALIRGCVIWAGLGDPASTEDPSAGRGRIRSEGDDDLGALGALLAALAESFHSELFATAEAVKRAMNDAVLHTALEEAGAVDKDGHVTAKATGYVFRSAQDRIVGGLRLVSNRRDKHAKHRLWCIEPCGIAGDAGDAGDVQSPTYTGNGPKPIGNRLEVLPQSPALPAAEPEANSSLEDRYGI